MRIIDKNQDFYDYQQDIFQDKVNTFDRTDSFLLTKDLMCQGLTASHHWDTSINRYLLLQVCNTFWLFYIRLTKFNEEPFLLHRPTDYEVTFISTWTDYTRERCLITLYSIGLDYFVTRRFCDYNIKQRNNTVDIDRMLKNKDAIVQSIKAHNYTITYNLTKCQTHSANGQEVVKTIPLLKASGLASFIDPREIYLAFDEFFSAIKQDAERTESVGITDNEKIKNHGFDTKSSFRGKIKKGTKNGQDSDSQKS